MVKPMELRLLMVELKLPVAKPMVVMQLVVVLMAIKLTVVSIIKVIKLIKHLVLVHF